MMTLDVVVIVIALCLFFWRAASDYDRADERSARTLRSLERGFGSDDHRTEST